MVDSMADDSETEQLIRSVEARPFLYDKKVGFCGLDVLLVFWWE